MIAAPSSSSPAASARGDVAEEPSLPDVSHESAAGTRREVKLSSLPVQQPREAWLGGTVPAALERCGRLSDGWLPPIRTSLEAASARSSRAARLPPRRAAPPGGSHASLGCRRVACLHGSGMARLLVAQ